MVVVDHPVSEGCSIEIPGGIHFAGRVLDHSRILLEMNHSETNEENNSRGIPAVVVDSHGLWVYRLVEPRVSLLRS